MLKLTLKMCESNDEDNLSTAFIKRCTQKR